MALPVTVAVPTVVPPLAQLVGALDCGPKTVKVIVPVGELPEASTAEREEAAIAPPLVPLEGVVMVSVVGVEVGTAVRVNGLNVPEGRAPQPLVPAL